MRDLIDNWWIPINLSFLSSGATRWGRIIFREVVAARPEITKEQLDLVTVPVQIFCPSVPRYIPNQVRQSGQGVTCSSILKYASVGVVLNGLVLLKYGGASVPVSPHTFPTPRHAFQYPDAIPTNPLKLCPSSSPSTFSC